MEAARGQFSNAFSIDFTAETSRQLEARGAVARSLRLFPISEERLEHQALSPLESQSVCARLAVYYNLGRRLRPANTQAGQMCLGLQLTNLGLQHKSVKTAKKW